MSPALYSSENLADVRSDYVDGFALAWRLFHSAAPHPAAVVLAAPSGSRSGMPSHLPWLLRTALPATLLVVADAAELPATITAVELHSDGVTARAAWR